MLEGLDATLGHVPLFLDVRLPRETNQAARGLAHGAVLSHPLPLQCRRQDLLVSARHLTLLGRLVRDLAPLTPACPGTQRTATVPLWRGVSSSTR